MPPLSQKHTERKSAILHMLQQADSVPLMQLAKELGASSSTIRRELRCLQEEGLVTLSVGKALLAFSSNKEPPYVLRSLLNREEKRRIALAALDLVQNGDIIFIGGGTTNFELARLLPGMRRLTVITNSLRVVNLLIDQPGIDLITLGGAVRPGEQTMNGHLTEWGVSQFRADKLFYGIEAVSLQHGLTQSQLEEVNTDRALAGAATEVIVLADHTKFNKVAPAFVMPLEQVHVIVTDKDLPGETAEALQGMGIHVVLA